MTDTWNEIREQHLNGSIDVDGNHFIKCRFGAIQFRYGGGQLPRFEECEYAEGVSWYFHGPALRTIRLLQFQNTDGAAEQMIDDLFKSGRVLNEE
jgi:hypothetical protein